MSLVERLTQSAFSRFFTPSLIKQMLLFFCLIPTGVAASNGIETVTLQLKWQHQFQFAGYYAALEKGFYREAGFDVKIQSHGPGLKSPVELVLSGAVQYGISDSSLVKHRLDGEPAVVLAVIFQKSPHAWLVRQDSGIRSPHDLVGKNAMYLPGLENGDLFAMLQVEGISASKINLTPTSFNVQDLIDGHTDAFNAYTTNEPYILRERGIPYRLITPQNYGIDFYGDVLFTSESEIDQHPERVKAFRLASLKGWKYAMDHPGEIVDLISNKYASNKSLPHLKFEAEATGEMIMPDLIAIGHMNPGRWRVIAERYVTLGFSEANYNLLEGFLYDPSPKPQDLKPFYVVIAAVALLALLFLALAIWIGRLNTHLKKSEQRYHELVDNMSDGVAVYEAVEDGHDFVFREYNRAGEKIGGIPRDQVLGHRVTEVFPGVEALGLLDVFRRVWKTGLSEDYPMTFYEDKRVGLWVENHVFKIPGGEIVAVYNDITEQKQAEKEKERLQRELQQTHKMEALGQLTGGIAHDFNNILGIIMGYTSMSLDRYGREVPEKMVDYLKTAMKASERAKALVVQMLTFSRRGNGEDAQSLQFAPLLNENVNMLHSILPSSIKVELNCEDGLPSVLMDPGKLQQLLMNLCVNARDAMNGVGTLTIALGWRRDIDRECLDCHKRIEGDWIELSVADTGSGMTPEILEHMLEPFYTTKDVGKGTGMGMAVLHGIVSGHGGHILIDTELDKGTTIRLLFPPAVEDSPVISESNQATDEFPEGAGRHVLVLDDELKLAEYIGDLLKLHGYQATIRTDSQEALSLFREDPDKFALLVTDQTMPGVTGIEVIKQLREVRPELPVILCTGFSEYINADDAEAMGIRYLDKPIDAERLVHIAGELLGLAIE